MKDSLYIKSQLDRELTMFQTLSDDSKKISKEKIDLLAWIYNFGKLRTENELRIKLRNVEEELLALTFQVRPDITIEKQIKAKLGILQDII